MPQPLTSIPLILLTIAAALSSVTALRRLGTPEGQRTGLTLQHSLVGVITLGCAGIFCFRWLILHESWQPLQAHVDGLLLIGTLLAGSILFIQARPRLFGLSAFALPLLTLILAWGICAALWTYRAFNLDSFQPVWIGFHTGSTYLGLLSCMIGAGAGAMYLFVQHRLKSKIHLPGTMPLASLETLETLIIRAATLGFVLLTLSLITGLIIVTQTVRETALGPSWWTSPKVWLATAAWATYALLLNVRYATSFRGRRAAWLAIGGLVLLLATYGAVEAIEGRAAREKATANTSAMIQAEARPCAS
ncbi:MAG: cytochrome c biogenesis protein CcsA [Planctomycetota bacterium]